MIRRAIFTAFFILLSLPSYSQFLPDLQAKTTAEYDAYLDVLDTPTLEKGAAFQSAFPHSSLRLPVCELMVREFRRQEKREQAIDSARRGLAIAPDYIPLLVELADLLSNSSKNLDEAAQSAQRALALSRTVKASLRVAPEDWTEALASLRARAHSSLGVIRFKKDDVAGAITEFKLAIDAHPPGDPAIHFRLGRLYALQGKKGEAKRHFEETLHSPVKELRDLARAALHTLEPPQP